MILQDPEKYPPESGYASPSHMGMPGEIWGAVKYLQDNHGWTDEEIVGLLGGNLIRQQFQPCNLLRHEKLYGAFDQLNSRDPLTMQPG